MKVQQLLKNIQVGIICIAAAVLSLTMAGVVRAEELTPTSTVGIAPFPAPAWTLGDPPMPAPATTIALAHAETAVHPDGTMNIHGTAFEDLNANGKRDAGEPVFAAAWFKVSGGGNWFVCVNTAGNGAFGVPVKAGLYHIQPVNLQGYRVTTPQVDVPAMGTQPATAYIGYVRDATATAEGCDSYNPSRPLM